MPAEEGSRRIDQLRRRAADNLVVDAYLLGFGAVFEAMAGSFDDARTHVAESCERLRDLGLTWRAGVQELLAGYIELLGGDPVAAERRMRAAKETFTQVGDRWFLSTVLVDLPRPLYEQARYAEARTAVEEIDEVPAPADREWQIKRWGVRARLLAREGQLEESERCARRGVAAASGTDMLWLRGDALTDLAEALTLAGRQTEAAEAAAEALGFYERKGIVPSASRAQTLIEQLGAADVTRLHRHPQ
jgi:hypothetical protein